MKLLKILAMSTVMFTVMITGAHADGSSGSRVLSAVAVTADGFVRLKGATDWDNPDMCDKSNFIWINPAASTYKEWVAMAYTAHASGAPLKGWVSGCYTRGGDSYPEILVLHME